MSKDNNFTQQGSAAALLPLATWQGEATGMIWSVAWTLYGNICKRYFQSTSQMFRPFQGADKLWKKVQHQAPTQKPKKGTELGCFLKVMFAYNSRVQGKQRG